MNDYLAQLQIKRAYDERSDTDGMRILVDRLWPRGLSKSDIHIDDWMKTVAPSPLLRKWFGHRPERWQQFRSRYWEELHQNADVPKLRSLAASRVVTLLYGAKDEQHNHALVLREFVLEVTPK